MFERKYFFMLLLLIVAVAALTSVSAADVNETDMDALGDNLKTTDELEVSNENNGNLALNLSDAGGELADGENSPSKEPDSILTISQSGNYYDDKLVNVKLTDLNGTPLKFKYITLGVYDKYNQIGYPCWSNSEFTDSKGIATFDFNYEDMMNAGTYTVMASSEDTVADNVSLTNFKISKRPLTIKVSNLVTAYNSGKTFNIRVVDSSGRGFGGVNLCMDIAKTRYSPIVRTDANGYVKFKASKLAPGTYKVSVMNEDPYSYSIKTKTASIKINKLPLAVVAKSVYNKKSGGVHIKVINKATKKPVNGIKLVLKVYTGSKYKTYKVVTGYDSKIYKSNGVAAIETNQLGVGNHKVAISISNKIYRGSAVANLKILKTAKYFNKYTGFLTGGKRVLNL